ncbi:MAG: type II secretion system F family protein, partial [Aureliella sp.]
GDTRPAMYHSLLHILAVAHAQRLELAPLVHNLAAEHRGGYRRNQRRFASRLASGVPLVAALEQTPGVLSDPMVLAIRFGSQSGALAATYDQLLRSRTPESIQLQSATRNELIYWSMLVVVIGVAMAFLMTVIAPTYLKIAQVTGLRLPTSFLTLKSLSNHVAAYPLLWTLVVLVVAWLIWSAAARNAFRRAVAQPLLGSIAQLRMAELYQLLAIAVEAGRPLPGSLSTLAKYHFDNQLRQKLLFARNEVEQGAELWSSLAAADILSEAESKALATSPSAGARAWLLRRLAAWKQSISYRREAAILVLIRPIVVLLLAAVVLWIASAFFGTLTSFILSESARSIRE